MVDVAEIRHPLQHARARFLQAFGNRHQFLVGGANGRREIPVAGAVRDGARGREADGACLDGLAHDGAHLGDFGVRRLLALRTALAHDVDAHGAMRHLHGDVDVVRALLDGVHVVAEAFPFPGEPLMQRGAGNILHAFHEADQPVVIGLPHGREADAAIAHDDGGGAVEGRRRHVAVPGHLAVIMGMDVDPAGRDEETRRFDFLAARRCDVADRDDDALVDGDIGTQRRAARTVHDRTAADNEIHLRHDCLLNILNSC